MDDVGYRKPPKNTQFKKGQSGNRKGRPKESPKNLNSIFNRALDRQVKVKEGEEYIEYSALEVMIMQLVQKATKGDLKAQKLLLPLVEKLNATNDAPVIPTMQFFRQCLHPNCPSHKKENERAV